jgi:hypothetical protein
MAALIPIFCLEERPEGVMPMHFIRHKTAYYVDELQEMAEGIREFLKESEGSELVGFYMNRTQAEALEYVIEEKCRREKAGGRLLKLGRR